MPLNSFFPTRKRILNFTFLLTLCALTAYFIPSRYQLANLAKPAVLPTVIDNAPTKDKDQPTPTLSAVLGEQNSNQNQSQTDLTQQFIEIKGNLGTLGQLIQKNGKFYLAKNVITNENIQWHTIKDNDLANNSVTSRIIKDHSIQSDDLESNLTMKDLTVEGKLSTDKIDLGRNTITDGNLRGNWNLNGGNLTTTGTITANAMNITGATNFSGNTTFDGMVTLGSLMPKTAGSYAGIARETVDANAGGVQSLGLVLGVDHFARMAYEVGTDPYTYPLYYLRCNDDNCSSPIITKLTDSTYGTYAGSYNMALGPDHLARILYMDTDTASLKMVRCLDEDCTDKNIDTIQLDDKTHKPGYYGAVISFGLDGFPIIAYTDGTSSYAIHYVRCTDGDCTSPINTVISVDSAWGFQAVAMDQGADHLPRLSYLGADNIFRYIRCTDQDCTSPIITAVDSRIANRPGYESNVLRIGSDGLARIVYTDGKGAFTTHFLICNNDDCTNPVITDIAATDGTNWSNGNGFDLRNGDLASISYESVSQITHIVNCLNSTCTEKTDLTVDDQDEAMDAAGSLVVGSDDFARLAYSGWGSNVLKYLKLTNLNGYAISGNNIGSESAPFGQIYSVGLNAEQLILQGNSFSPFLIENSNGNSIFSIGSNGGINDALFFSNGNIGIGTVAPSAKIDIRGDAYRLSNNTVTKEFSINFPNTISNQKVDFYMPGYQSFSGTLEITVTDSYNYQNATGLIKKVYGIGFDPDNHIYSNESRYTEVLGATPDNWALSDLSWDVANSRYKITLVHRTNTANTPRISIKAFGRSSGDADNAATFMAGNIYTTDATAYGRPYEYFNSNVGIGTAVPNEKLEVAGAITLTGTSTNGRPILSQIYSSPNVGFKYDAPGAGSGWYGVHDFYTGYNGGASTLTMRIKNGNVGIGTANPATKLELYQASQGNSTMPMLLSNPSGLNDNTTVGMGFNVGAVAKGGVFYNRSGGIYGLGDIYFANNQTANDTTVVSVNDVKMVIKNSGNVGIGTTSPGAKLEVSDDGSIISGVVTLFGKADPTGYWRIRNAGNPTTRRVLEGYDGTNLVISFDPRANAPSYINTGNVGIGTTAPSEKLEVAGNIRVTGGSFIDDGTTLNVPDYIFEPGYNLKSLPDLETYINQNLHLPNVPSQDQIKKTGMNYGSMLMSLLEKTEENTLYTIDNYHQITQLDSRLNSNNLSTDDKMNIISQNLTDLNLKNQELADLQKQAAAQTKDLASLQKQMDELQAQAKPLIDFYLAMDLKDMVLKDTLGNITLLDGKITAKDIEALNTFKAKDIEATDSLKGQNLELGAQVSGTSVIKAGELESNQILTTEAKRGIKLYITPKGSTQGKTLYYNDTDIEDSVGFKVKIDAPTVEKDIEFNWLIIK